MQLYIFTVLSGFDQAFVVNSKHGTFESPVVH